MRVVPSIIAHVLNGILTFSAIVFGLYHLNALKKLDIFKVMIIILLFAIAVGVHSMSHLGLEKEYKYLRV